MMIRRALFAAVAALVLATGCGPISIVTAPSRAVAVRTCAANADVELNAGGFPALVGGLEPGNGVRGPADAAGDHTFTVPASVTAVNLHVRASGFLPYDVRILVPARNTQLLLGPCVPLTNPDLQIQLAALLPEFKPLPRLVVRTPEFLGLETGERWFGAESTDFHLLGRWLNGEDIRPVLEQRSALGFNVLRIWTAYDLSQFGIGTLNPEVHPELYRRLPEFLRLIAGYGFYADLTAYTGLRNNAFAFDPQHWAKLCAAVQGSTNVAMLSLQNEGDQPSNNFYANVPGFDLGAYRPCPGILSSLGSNGSQAWPPTDGGVWDLLEFHSNGADQWWRKQSHNAWEITQAAGMRAPIFSNETTRYTDQDTSLPHVEGSFAACKLLVASCVFHAIHGKNSTLFVDDELAAAKAAIRGARAIPLNCQDAGGYVHRADLEGPGESLFLRVYQRGGDPACIAPVPN